MQVGEEVALEDGRRRQDAARSVYHYLVDFIRPSYTLVHVRTLEWFEGIHAFRNEFLLKRFYDYAVLRGDTKFHRSVSLIYSPGLFSIKLLNVSNDCIVSGSVDCRYAWNRMSSK